MSNRSTISNGKTTYKNQTTLSKLPIPDLPATLEKYLATVKPIQQQQHHQKTIEAVAEFRKTDAPRLQEVRLGGCCWFGRRMMEEGCQGRRL